jgi:Rrf2 family protein
MLSVTAEHALRALAEMARLGRGEAILGKQLARIAEIPRNYLAKILWLLGNAGLIDATRGSGGGYRLRRHPKDIRLIEVVELFDRPNRNSHCFLSCHRECSDADSCAAHARWREVRRVFDGFLDTTTVAEIAESGAGQNGQPLPALGIEKPKTALRGRKSAVKGEVRP